ncbi:MAG: GNAT family N-acetyltransferase [Anaerolineae bacterium]|nr:GNAT family N-acetyltransferase [Anaerolineae bacterium]
MQVQTYDDPHAWYARAEPFLLLREARHNLMLGLSHTLRQTPGVYEGFFLAVVEDAAGEVVGAVLRTLPYNAILSHFTDTNAISLVAQTLYDRFGVLPGVSGAPTEAEPFVATWQALTGAGATVAMPEMIYALEQVIPPAPVPGGLRPATEADKPLMARWHYNFMVDATPWAGPDYERSQRWAENAIASSVRRVFFWEVDGQPVSMVGATGPTPNGIRIGPVYTPPEVRGRGYASAMTAGLSQLLLDEGRRFCFLYTDANNPTSNKIYRAIGYEYVCDSVVMHFNPPTP